MSVTTIPGLITRDHLIEVPLDHANPDGRTLEVYAREVALPDGTDRPFLVYLQGGPGSEAPRPTLHPSGPPWLERALAEYRVLMLDQRGTGRSTPYGRVDGGDPGMPEEQAEYLTHLRADSIVADAEAMREHLGVARWSVLGQSFGGFTTLHYLSAHAEALAEAYFTGGLPPVGRAPEEIYARTYDALRAKSLAFYRRYPQARGRVRELIAACERGEVVLPGGEVVSPRRLRTLGHRLGGSGGAEALAYLFDLDHRSPAFAYDLRDSLPFDGRNPLYAVVHESSYADGFATQWAADRAFPDDFAADDTLLTGEHLYPWHFEESGELAPYREVAEIIARHPWPKLYDADALRAVDVPCAAMIYADDAYVDRDFSEETAALLPRMHRWVSNEYEHNGLRADGARILDRLFGLAKGRIA